MTEYSKSNAFEILGVDVASKELVCATADSKNQFTCGNDAKGLRKLVKFLQSTGLKRVVCEATGNYERELVKACQQAGFPVAVVNPKRVRDFAKSQGRHEKSDPIDATMIAHYAEVSSPRNEPIRTEKGELREALIARREQLMKLRTAEKNRLHLAHPGVQESISGVIETLNKQIHDVEQQIDALDASCAETTRKREVLQSVKGVGDQTARVLLIEVPELGSLNRRKVAKLVGLAPFMHQSGKKQGKSAIGFGRKQPRTALYMAVMSAVRCNPQIRDFYQRLLKKGKHKMVAFAAAMRKLLTVLNALIKKDELWQPSTAKTT
jgi:transposase